MTTEKTNPTFALLDPVRSAASPRPQAPAGRGLKVAFLAFGRPNGHPAGRQPTPQGHGDCQPHHREPRQGLAPGGGVPGGYRQGRPFRSRKKTIS